MRLVTRGFWLIPFYFSKIRLFSSKVFKYLARVLQGYRTQQALQNQNFDSNRIKRYSVLIYQRVYFLQKYSFAIYVYNGTLGTFVTQLRAMTVTVQGFFCCCIFWTFPSIMSAQMSKICQLWPCTITGIAQRQDGLHRFPRCHCRDKWQSYLFV